MKRRGKIRHIGLLLLLLLLSGCSADTKESQFTQMNTEYLRESTPPADSENEKGETKDVQEKDTERAQDVKNPESEKPSDDREGESPSASKAPKEKKKPASAKTEASKASKEKKKSLSAKAEATKQPESKKEYCTITIECSSILQNRDSLNEAKAAFVPEDGVILKKTKVQIESGDNAYIILERTCRKYKIHFEASYTPVYKTYYVEGIHQLYEFDCGNTSGWMYLVNGEKMNYGCSKYSVKAGDDILWTYSCKLGKDV